MMKANTPSERMYNGIIKENPTFVLLIGMCPTLAVTTSAINGLGMGLTTAVILTLSNFMISLLRNVIPDKVRIPSFIVIVASFVTIVQFLLEGYLPSLYGALGIYIPLIVVNCIILGRAEAYASKNPPMASFFDGLGMGLGFTIALTIIGSIREILGAGQIFGLTIMPSAYEPITIFILAPGAFFVLAFLVAAMNKFQVGYGRKPKSGEEPCRKEDCMSCGNLACHGRIFQIGDGPESKGPESKAPAGKAAPQPEAESAADTVPQEDHKGGADPS